MRAILVLAMLCAPPMAAAQTEVGKLNAVPFRIDVPEHWNHGLVVYYHGYSVGPTTYTEGKLSPVLAPFTERGYALVQSAYSRSGWAVQQAVPETEALREYFVKNHGAPRETFVAGHSMGGFLTVDTIEKFPERYAGALSLCGAIQSAPELLQRAFEFEAIFDYYFPGLLPPPNKVPADFQNTRDKVEEVEAQLQSEPAKAAALRQISRLKRDREVAATAVFVAFTLKDVQERSGGNPFSNRNTIYYGSPDDNGLNDGVKRYDADASLAYLETYATLTGKLRRPVLAIHDTYDPLVPVSVPDDYAMRATVGGSRDLFVLQYVEHEGHCNITPAEVGKGFDELLAWTHQHKKPRGGRLVIKNKR